MRKGYHGDNRPYIQNKSDQQKKGQPILAESEDSELQNELQDHCENTNMEGGNESEEGHIERVCHERVHSASQLRTMKRPSVNNWNKLRKVVETTNMMKQRVKRKNHLERQDSFLKRFSTRQVHVKEEVETGDATLDAGSTPNASWHVSFRRSVNVVIMPSGSLMFYWLGIVTSAVLYNLWTCIAREAFREIQTGYDVVWFSLDALFDLIFLLDIFVQFRTGYLEQGLMVYDSSKLSKRYVNSSNFYLDLICLLPLDLLQVYTGIHPMLRFPRFLKAYRTIRFLHMLESRAAFPNLFRVANLTHMLFLGSHWFAAFYYLISEAEGFQGHWAYPPPDGEFSSVTRKYLMSLYWSTLTLTTIGDLPPPNRNTEYVFVIVSYLIGVFVFATIVGQVGNVITNRNASRQEFERLLDSAKSYMRMHNVPHELRKRVQRWYDYVWSRGRLNGSWDINALGILPDKLKTELALYVNLETLKKVTIFQECQPEFLHDLVLKMKAYIFTPGDLICRNSEVAREMFIIADGVVDVIGDMGTILTQMSTGDFFGEIGILNLDGGINRRTADVRSVGYSELFVLSRDDVLSALKDNPEAEKIIRDYGQKRLRQIEAHRQKIKPPSPPETAELQTPLSVVRLFSRKNTRKVTDSHANRAESDGYVNKTVISKDINTTRHNSTASGGAGDSDGTNGGGIKSFLARTMSQRQKVRSSKPPQLPSRDETRSFKRPSVLRRFKESRSSSQVEVSLPRRGRRPDNVIPGVVDFCPSETDFCDDSNSSVYKHLLVPDKLESDIKPANCDVVTAEHGIPHLNEVVVGAFKNNETLTPQDSQTSIHVPINKNNNLLDDSNSVFELAGTPNSSCNMDRNVDIANAFIHHLAGSIKAPKSALPPVVCATSTTICSKITCSYCKSLECNKLDNSGLNLPLTYPKHKRGKSVDASPVAELHKPGKHTCCGMGTQKHHPFQGGLPISNTPWYSSSCTEINAKVSRSGNPLTALLSPLERHGLLAGTSTRSDSAPSLTDCSMKSLPNIHNYPITHSHHHDRQHPLALYR